MPVIRQGPDTTLADTLGNLGSSITNVLNPLNQVRAQNFVSEIQQRQWEIQRQQALDAANRNAADVYERSNPFNEDPASLAVSAAKIRNGQGDLGASISALKAAGTYASAQAAAGLIDAAHPEWSPAQRASAKSDILSGRKNLSEVESDFATAGLTTAKTSAALAASNAASAAASGSGMDTEAAPLAASAALTDPVAAEKLIAGQRARLGATSMPADTSQFSPAVTEETQRQLEAGQTPTLPAQIQPQKIATDTGQAVAKNVFGPHPADQPVTGGTVDASGNVVIAPPVKSGQPPAPAPPPVPGTVSVTPAPADIASSEATESGKTTAHEVAAGDVKVLDQAISESGAAQSMKAKLSQLRDLADALDTSGSGLTSRVLRTLAEYNVHPGDIGATYAAIQQIINAEIPDVRQKAGIQRLAGPAIKEEQLILGTANMPKKTLMNIIANEDAAADLQISRAQLAYQARTGQMPMSDYYKQSLALDATIKQHTDELRNQYKAIGTEKTRPPDEALPAAPAFNTGSTMDAIRALITHLTGNSAQTPPAPANNAPPPPSESTFDIQNGRLVPLRR